MIMAKIVDTFFSPFTTSMSISILSCAGEYHFAESGDVYVGSWVNHRMEGRGKIVYGNNEGDYEGGCVIDRVV